MNEENSSTRRLTDLEIDRLASALLRQMQWQAARLAAAEMKKYQRRQKREQATNGTAVTS